MNTGTDAGVGVDVAATVDQLRPGNGCLKPSAAVGAGAFINGVVVLVVAEVWTGLSRDGPGTSFIIGWPTAAPRTTDSIRTGIDGRTGGGGGAGGRGGPCPVCPTGIDTGIDIGIG